MSEAIEGPLETEISKEKPAGYIKIESGHVRQLSRNQPAVDVLRRFDVEIPVPESDHDPFDAITIPVGVLNKIAADNEVDEGALSAIKDVIESESNQGNATISLDTYQRAVDVLGKITDPTQQQIVLIRELHASVEEMIRRQNAFEQIHASLMPPDFSPPEMAGTLRRFSEIDQQARNSRLLI